MKLLFDENLSPRLKQVLADVYPECLHVRDIGLESTGDATVWEYAGEHGFIIVSKDSDFRQMSFTSESPPKVIWIGLGNCSTAAVVSLLRHRYDALIAFEEDTQSVFLALS